MEEFKSVWEFDLLFTKAKLYTQKAISEERDSSMFPFWSALSLEFLGRAVVAKIHPVLLADPREGDNILYVFGFSKGKSSPKSIPAKSVFDRCSKIVPDFTQKEIDTCLALVDKRNEELHSGSAAFQDYDTKLWLSNYYRVCKILLTYLELQLIDLFGEAEADAAEEMIKETTSEAVKEVKKRINSYKEVFESKEAEEKEELIKKGLERLKQTFQPTKKVEKCVSCQNDALVTGKLISSSEGRLIDGEIVVEDIILPTNLNCFVCGLKLTNHLELNIADLGGQYSIKEVWDPAEYHGIEFDPSDFYDYGND